MADVVLTRKDILSIMEKGQVDARYSSCKDFAHLPISLALYVIEKEKKRENKTPVGLKKLFDNMPECVNLIPLSQGGLYEAMCNQNFSDKYINRMGNPFEFATEASVYEPYGWWDRGDLLESFKELLWI